MATSTSYLLNDLLYRSTALTDDSGAIEEAYDTDAYGNTQTYSAAGTGGNWFADDAVTTDQPECETIFTGRQFDPESQIYFYRARYYHPVLGRFVSRDPLNYYDGLNLYQFLAGNPTVGSDPTGLSDSLNSPDECWKHWSKEWLDEVKNQGSAAWKKKIDDAVKDCTKEGANPAEKDSKKDENAGKEFIKCLSKKLPGIAGLTDFAANLFCCLTTGSQDTVDPPGRQKNQPQTTNCLAACNFFACTRAAKESWWSLKDWKTWINAGADLMKCECECAASKNFQPEE